MTTSPRSVMQKAWALARAGARRFGGRARQYLAEALRQAWAEVRAGAARIAEQTARVLASFASLPAEIAAVDALMDRFYATMPETAEERCERLRAEREAVAKVLPFPARVPAAAPALPLRRAA